MERCEGQEVVNAEVGTRNAEQRGETLPPPALRQRTTALTIATVRLGDPLPQGRLSALGQLSFIAAARRYALGFTRRFRPDASLAFFGMPSGAVAWLLKKVYRVPYVVSLRGGDVPGFRPYDFKTVHMLMGPFLHAIWHTASSVVANSRGLRDLARAFDAGIDIPIIPNGVDVTRYAPVRRAWTPPRLL